GVPEAWAGETDSQGTLGLARVWPVSAGCGSRRGRVLRPGEPNSSEPLREACKEREQHDGKSRERHESARREEERQTEQSADHRSEHPERDECTPAELGNEVRFAAGTET